MDTDEEYRNMGDEGYGEGHGSGLERRRRDAFDKMMMDRVVDMRMQDFKDQDVSADERMRRDTMEKTMMENMGEYKYGDMEGSQTDYMERRRRALLEGIGEQVDMAYEQEKRKKRSLGKMVF